MSVEIIKNLQNTQKLINNLINLDTVILEAAKKAETYVLQNWKAGIGSNDKTLQSPKISKEYKAVKKDINGRDYIDMILTGKMTQAFKAFKQKKNEYYLSVIDAEMDKLRGNYLHRPQIMTVGVKLRQLVNDYVFNKIRV